MDLFQVRLRVDHPRRAAYTCRAAAVFYEAKFGSANHRGNFQLSDKQRIKRAIEARYIFINIGLQLITPSGLFDVCRYVKYTCFWPFCPCAVLDIQKHTIITTSYLDALLFKFRPEVTKLLISVMYAYIGCHKLYSVRHAFPFLDVEANALAAKVGVILLRACGVSVQHDGLIAKLELNHSQVGAIAHGPIIQLGFGAARDVIDGDIVRFSSILKRYHSGAVGEDVD